MERLTNEQCRDAHLPGRSPFEPFEELDWFPIETPAQDVQPTGHFEVAAAILGSGSSEAAA